MTGRRVAIGVMLICSLQTGPVLAQLAIPAEVGRLFVGVWKAVPGGLYSENADGSRTYPFGQDAVTRFILTSEGFGANTLQFRDRAKCVSGTGPRNCTTVEAEAAFQTSSSYQYRYRFEPDADDPYKGKMIWDVDLTVYPNWEGQKLTRRYEMKRDGSSWMFTAPTPSNPQLGLRVYLERAQP